ncbi:MAG: YihY/virulence factor BrkB family protein [Clostridia bacterium]|nr:YihY/virulence factor BrkB family protein [Clostridia bacterium]
MKKWSEHFKNLKEKYDLLVTKKYTTIAGTLVFFLIMSVVPFSFWLSLILGKLPFDGDEIIRMNVFESVKEILEFIQTEAQNATTGASVFLALTTLYSATNLFYQMRKSGEIIYEYKKKSGWRLRFTAFLLLFVAMAFVGVALGSFAIVSFLSARIFSEFLQSIFAYLLLGVIAFLLVLFLNAYICPYPVKLKNFLSGTWVTILGATIALVGFSVYLKIGNLGRLYGALSAVIVFLLWLYLLMICFVSGAILNSEKILKDDRPKRRTQTFF